MVDYSIMHTSLTPKQIVYIYVLLDPEEVPFYVGKTVNLKRRQRNHLNRANAGITLHVYNKIRKLLEDGKQPGMRILEETNLEECDARERFHIQRLKDEGFHLTNLTSGGEGGAGFTEESTRKRLETRRRNGHGQHSEETKRKMSAAKKGRSFSPEHCLALRQGWKRTPEQLQSSSSKAARTSKGKINIKCYVCTSPEGVEHMTQRGLSFFCEQNGLARAYMHQVLAGKRESHRGWKIRRYEEAEDQNAKNHDEFDSK